VIELQIYTKSEYKELYNETIGEDAKMYNMLWKLNALLLTQQFAWKVMPNMVETKDDLIY